MALYGVYGASGCGRGILPIVRECLAPGASLVFVDDGKVGQIINGQPTLSFGQFVADSNADKRICLAIADPAVRRHLAEQCDRAGLEYFSVRHPVSVTMDANEIGPGSLLSPFTTVTSNVRIGKHFHCNLYSYVEHDCVIGDFVTFAPAVRCNGNVTIGHGAYIGSGAVLRQGVTIGENAVVGMGAIVTKDVPAGETWIGNPARAMQVSVPPG